MSSVKHGPFPDPKWVRVKWSQRLGPRRFAPTSQGAISWHSYNNPATEALRLGPFSEIFRQVTSIVILSNHPYLLHRSGDYFFGYSLEQNCIYTHYIYIYTNDHIFFRIAPISCFVWCTYFRMPAPPPGTSHHLNDITPLDSGIST